MICDATFWYWDIIRDERHADIRRHLMTGGRLEWVHDWYWLRGLLTQDENRQLCRLAAGRAALEGMTK